MASGGIDEAELARCAADMLEAGIPAEEIARMAGVPAETVLSWCRRAAETPERRIERLQADIARLRRQLKHR